MLMLAVLTVVIGGLIGSPFWWVDGPSSFGHCRRWLADCQAPPVSPSR